MPLASCGSWNGSLVEYKGKQERKKQQIERILLSI